MSDLKNQKPGTDCILQITTPRNQKVVAFFLMLLFAGVFGTAGFISMVHDIQFPFANPHIHFEDKKNAGIELICALLGFIIAFGSCIYVCWNANCYYFCVDENGVTQSDGFRTARVLWSDIKSYRWERSKVFSLPGISLLDSHGRVIFRTYPHLVSCISIEAKRREMWRYIAARVDAENRKK